MLSFDDLGTVFIVLGCVLLSVTIVRVLYSTVGRWLGFYNPAHFHLFLWIPWRFVWRWVVSVRSWHEERSTMGREATSRWAPLLDRLCLVYKPGFILLGRHRAGGIAIQQPAGIDNPRGVTIIADPGTGKSTQAVSWIALDPGNAFIIDPKGQLANVTARRKGAGGPGIIGQRKKVRILDPMHQVPEFTSAMWNLFDLLTMVENRFGSDVVVRFANHAAKALVLRTGQELSPFFPDICEQFLTGAILDIYTNEPPSNRTLSCLYNRVCNGWPEGKKTPEERAMFAWFRRMIANKAFDGVIAASANAVQETGTETYGNILVSIRQYIQWLMLPEVKRVCSSGTAANQTDVNLEELVTGDLVLYVCAPAGDIRGPLSGWFRLLTTLSLYICEVLNKTLRYPTLFLLDEFPALGRLEYVEIAAGLMRSMSVRLVIIAQNIGQLRIYNNPGAFLGGNCLYMGSNDDATLQHIEKTAGYKTVRREVKGVEEQPGRDRVEMLTEPVIRADDAKQIMGRGNIIVVLPENRSFITKRTRYFDFLPVCFYDNDKRERVLRRPMRHFFVRMLRLVRTYNLGR